MSDVLIPLPVREFPSRTMVREHGSESRTPLGEEKSRSRFNQVALSEAPAALYPTLFSQVNGPLSPCVLSLRATCLWPHPRGVAFVPGSLSL